MSTMNSISFPPGTITSKLDSKKLKNPPNSNDWMHQTYLEMIQDVSYVTSHYYESKDNGNQLLFGNNNKVCPETHCPKKSASLEDIKGKEKEQAYDSDDDTQSEVYNSFTTSSTDCNRRNNIYRFYREQQSLQADPITEESSVIRVATPYSSNSNYYVSNISDVYSNSSDVYSNSSNIYSNSSNIYSNSSNIYSNNSNISEEEIQRQQNDDDGTVTQQHGRKSTKTKFKLFKNMMTKMRLAAEKPFWAIDSHF